MPSKRKRVLMVTPHSYSYGGLLISGIISSMGYDVEVTRRMYDIQQLGKKKEVMCLSLQSTTDLFRVRPYLRKINRSGEKLVIAGGPAVLDPVFASNILPQVDLFALGEGDETIGDILRIREKEDMESIRGVAFVRDHKLVKTPQRRPPQLIGRPFPLIPKGFPKQFIRGVNVYIETHRGCPGRCIFCQYSQMFNTIIRNRPIEDIVAEVKYFCKHGAKRIAFSGGDISVYGSQRSAERGRGFLELVKRTSEVVGKDNLAGPDIRIDSLSPAILEGVRKFTQGWIFLGIESGSKSVQKLIRKNIKLEEVYSAVRLAKQYSVRIVGSFMVGFIGETVSDFLETKKVVEDLGLDRHSINIVEPLPGTAYWEMTKACPIEKNPLFMPSDGGWPKFKNRSVAEERALMLIETIYKARHRRPMSKIVFGTKALQIRKEAERIRSIIKSLKQAQMNSASGDF